MQKYLPPQVSIRALREAHGLTRRQVAERIREMGVSVDEDSLGHVEIGTRKAGPALIKAWAIALNVDPLDVRQEPDLRLRLGLGSKRDNRASA